MVEVLISIIMFKPSLIIQCQAGCVRPISRGGSHCLFNRLLLSRQGTGSERLYLFLNIYDDIKM